MKCEKHNVDNTFSTTDDDPITVLNLKKWVYVYGSASMLWALWFSIFGVIIPYLTTGDFAEIWPPHRKSVAIKVSYFVCAWVYLLCFPAIVPFFRSGDISLHETSVRLKPFLSLFDNICIPYELMTALERKPGQIILINGKVPERRGNIFKYWKTIYWRSIFIPANTMLLRNPECQKHAFQIIHERANTITK